jgi:hypothetical protein
MTEPTVQPSEKQSTYPASWVDLPGTRTQKPSPEHPNAKEQQYFLQDEAQPVKKGKHTRDVLRSDPPQADNLMAKN